MKEEVLKQLNWRYATKTFNPNKKLTQEEINYLLNAIQLSPSSSGLQAWKCVVITDPETRKQLREVSFNQPQVTDSSCLFVFCSQQEVSEDYIDDYIELVATTREMELSKLDALKQSIKGSVSKMTSENMEIWLAKQVYIPLGILLTTCAINGFDACPMEGFQKEKYDQILNLDHHGLKSQVLCSVGYRDENDWLSKLKKVRFSQDDLFIKI
ncbi:MAG: NAD(P)H-dependent oxidoreductase [Leptospiraceae bacterium]|nr:NAD(P)H-dependent oxidoreductase [Leptospiraceae bacterium]